MSEVVEETRKHVAPTRITEAVTEDDDEGDIGPPITEGIFNSEQNKMFRDLRKLDQKRQKILKKIEQKGMTEIKAQQKFGRDLERLTDDIQRKANDLMEMIKNKEGKNIFQRNRTAEEYQEIKHYAKTNADDLISAAVNGSLEDFAFA